MHDDVAHRSTREDFISRGLASRNDARRTGKYFDAGDVHAELENMLKAELAGRLRPRI